MRPRHLQFLALPNAVSSEPNKVVHLSISKLYALREGFVHVPVDRNGHLVACCSNIIRINDNGFLLLANEQGG
jgi:hypothetical protein